MVCQHYILHICLVLLVMKNEECRFPFWHEYGETEAEFLRQKRRGKRRDCNVGGGLSIAGERVCVLLRAECVKENA